MGDKKNLNNSQKTESVRARVSPETKESTEEILRNLGLSTSEAIRIFLKQVKLSKGLPFRVRYPNSETRKAIDQAKEGEQVSSFSSPDAVYEDLDI